MEQNILFKLGLMTCFLACSAAVSQPVKVQVKVLEYQVGGSHDQFEDGSCRFYDVTVMSILGPADYADSGNLSVVHDAPPGAESPWRQVGETYQLEVDAETLRQAQGKRRSVVLFPSAFSDWPRKPDSPREVLVEAKILAYKAAEVHEWFEDGSAGLYDLTEVTILGPPAYVGKGTLFIVHDQPQPQTSDWRKVGEVFRFEVPRKGLDRALDETESAFLYSSMIRGGLR